jgi:RND family efflux transporter MFP subunit
MKRGLALIAAALLVAACAKQEPKVAEVRPVRVQTVTLGAQAAVSGYSGEVRARYETRLAFRVPGKILSRHVDVGALVKSGQLLARLDPKDLVLAEESAKAQLASARSERDLAGSELARYQDLYQKKFISQADLDRRENTHKTAAARLEALQAQYQSSANQASYAALHADAAGVVLAVEAEAGQVVSAGQPVMRIARLEEKEIEINVSEQNVEQLRSAGPLLVRAWALPQKLYKGRVREIAPAADPATRTFAVRVSVPDADAALRLGMTASVALPNAPDALAQTSALLPMTALYQKGEQAAVWVLGSDSRLQLRPVEIGQYREDGVVIARGLANGERVVTAGVHKLIAGQAVRPLPEAAPAPAASQAAVAAAPK